MGGFTRGVRGGVSGRLKNMVLVSIVGSAWRVRMASFGKFC